MADTFFSAHIDALQESLAGVVKDGPWTYALVLFVVSKLVNSQAAALVAVAPIGLALGLSPTLIIALYGASYGYFIPPTYPSDLACIGFDRTGTTRIGKFVMNHSFIVPGLISVHVARGGPHLGVGPPVGRGSGWDRGGSIREPGHEQVRGHRASEVVALHHVAADVAQRDLGGLVLDALGHQHQVQGVGQLQG